MVFFKRYLCGVRKEMQIDRKMVLGGDCIIYFLAPMDVKTQRLREI